MNPMSVLNWLVFVTFYSTIPYAIYLNGNFNYYWDRLKTSFSEDEASITYDFIVVGSGSAGGIIANRLSKNNKVLLLEAGGNPLFHNSIPGLTPALLGVPFTEFSYFTVPQKHSQFGMNEQRSYWPRGKVMGGSSTLNYMLYVRGHPYDYDQWSKITGDPEWSYENVIPFFKKTIDYRGNFKNNRKHHESTPYGYLIVDKQHHKPLEPDFLAAGRELGFNSDIDVNGPQTVGFGSQELLQNNGKRWSIYDAFIKNFEYRDNLKVSRYSYAIKVQLDKNNKATGVWYVKNGKKKFAKASKEVILSAGSVDSPKLLMLSGIGPKEHLSSLKIKTKINLPVGKFLKDHVAVNLYPFLINETKSLINERDIGWQTMVDYFMYGKGPLSIPGEAYSQAFYPTSQAKKSGATDWSNIQLYMLSFGASQGLSKNLALGFNMKPGYMEEIFDPITGQDMFTLMSVLGRPKSSGDYKLASKDPFEHPLLNPNYLENQEDVDALVEAVKFSIKVGEETMPFKKMGARLADELIRKGCEDKPKRSDAFWECYVRNHGRTLFHPIGTCRMGKGVDDPQAVVDSNLRVLGSRGLRVADASVMPEITNGNTQAPTMMIAEKAAYFIRSHWASQYLICSNTFLDKLGFILFKQEKCFYSRLT